MQSHELGDFPVLSPPPNILPWPEGQWVPVSHCGLGSRLKIRTEDCWWPEVRVAGELGRRTVCRVCPRDGVEAEGSLEEGLSSVLPWKTCLLRENWGVKPVPS